MFHRTLLRAAFWVIIRPALDGVWPPIKQERYMSTQYKCFDQTELSFYISRDVGSNPFKHMTRLLGVGGPDGNTEQNGPMTLITLRHIAVTSSFQYIRDSGTPTAVNSELWSLRAIHSSQEGTSPE
ncbi:hypothetical protein C8R43DRAFT_954729 [Mycena crocata]|nr:hypothetical protein C8R43DRAFT_954729 [Mycena crocata]